MDYYDECSTLTNNSLNTLSFCECIKWYLHLPVLLMISVDQNSTIYTYLPQQTNGMKRDQYIGQCSCQGGVNWYFLQADKFPLPTTQFTHPCTLNPLHYYLEMKWLIKAKQSNKDHRHSL